MRIISGKYKGKRLLAPKKLPVRPTTDRAKEALFNILNNYYHFSELKILDLFAGTGNISYEFASRGTTSIMCVDTHFGCISYIKKMSKLLDFDITTIKSDVLKYLQQCKTEFDIVFADPPYNLSQENFEKIAILSFENKLVSPEGMLIIEHAKQTSLAHCKYFSFAKTYNSSTFSFFKWEEEDN